VTARVVAAWLSCVWLLPSVPLTAQEPAPLPAPLPAPFEPSPDDTPLPAPVEELPRARPAPVLEELSWLGGVGGLVAALALQAGVCAPLALVGCAMTAGPVLFYTQGVGGNACWLLPLAAAGAVVALALGVVGPLGASVVVGAVNDITVGGRAPLFTVAAFSVAGTWVMGLVMGAPVLVAAAFTWLWVAPQLQRLSDERAKTRQTGFSTEMLGLWGGSVLLGAVVLAACALMFVVGSAVPVFLADVLTRKPEPAPVKRAPRVRKRRKVG